jgi:aspartate aminotransferase
LSLDAAKAVADLAEDYDFWIITDEAYKTLIYEGSHVYIYKLAPERTISINTFSKDPAIPGWRLGYVYGPPEVIPKIKLMNEEMVYCPPSFAPETRGDISTVRGKDAIHQGGGRGVPPEERRGGVCAEEVRARGEIRGAVRLHVCVCGPGALHPRRRDFRQELLERYGVAAVPGAYFSEVYKAAIRISFVTETPQRLEEGIRRIGEAVGAK